MAATVRRVAPDGVGHGQRPPTERACSTSSTGSASTRLRPRLILGKADRCVSATTWPANEPTTGRCCAPLGTRIKSPALPLSDSEGRCVRPKHGPRRQLRAWWKPPTSAEAAAFWRWPACGGLIALVAAAQLQRGSTTFAGGRCSPTGIPASTCSSVASRARSFDRRRLCPGLAGAAILPTHRPVC